jgi:hypothetical protein
MTTINVQFADSTEQVVVAYFAAPQSATAWPNQGTVDSSSALWATYYNSLPEFINQGMPAPTT